MDGIRLTREEWKAAIDRDGGEVLTVDDGVASWSITPAYVGFDHVDMIDHQMAYALECGRLWPETRDAFLDARSVWVAREREGSKSSDRVTRMLETVTIHKRDTVETMRTACCGKSIFAFTLGDVLATDSNAVNCGKEPADDAAADEIIRRRRSFIGQGKNMRRSSGGA